VYGPIAATTPVGADQWFPAFYRQCSSVSTTLQFEMKGPNIPKFIAVSVCKYKIRQFFHHGLGRGVHEIKRISVIWLRKLVFGGESSPWH
jgi:hypothetical protein